VKALNELFVLKQKIIFLKRVHKQIVKIIVKISG